MPEPTPPRRTAAQPVPGEGVRAGLRVTVEDPASPDAVRLVDELTRALEAISGDGGRSSFDAADVRAPRAAFVVARSATGEAVGCGAIRPLSPHVAELKRMYARPGTTGVGSAVLTALEDQARRFGYEELWLETRRANQRAVGFYAARGFRTIESYGRYAGRGECICMGKELIPGVRASGAR